MGLLSSLIGSKKEKLRLVSVVEKIENSPYGAFANINNDLAHYSDKVGISEDPLRLMAYAYARRTAMACLYFQGVIEKDAYDHASLVFKGYQQTTGQTVEFQEEAAAQSWELIQSYTTALSKQASMFITSMVEMNISFDRSFLDRGHLSVEGLAYIANEMMVSRGLVK